MLTSVGVMQGSTGLGPAEVPLALTPMQAANAARATTTRLEDHERYIDMCGLLGLGHPCGSIAPSWHARIRGVGWARHDRIGPDACQERSAGRAIRTALKVRM